MQKKQPEAKKSINGEKSILSKKTGKRENVDYSYVEALKKSEERYSLAQRLANIGSWDWDIHTGARSWSDGIDALFGFKKGSFKKTYKAFIECVHPDDRKSVSSAINGCINMGKSYHIEHRVIWPNGSIHWLLQKGDVMRDKNGRAARMLAVVHDITERKRNEEDLEMVSRFPAENPSPVMRISNNGKILFANDASDAVLKKWKTTTGSNVPNSFYKIVKETFSTGKRKEIDIEIDRTIFSCILVPIKDNNYLNFYARDITARKKAEEALQKSKEMYKNVVQTQSELICRSTPDSVITFANDAYARYYNKTPESIIGTSYKDHMFEEEYLREKKLFSKLTPKKPTIEFEHRVTRPNGEVRWQRWSDIGLFDREGKLIEIQSVGRDITEQKNAEESIKKKNESLQILSEAASLLLSRESPEIIASHICKRVMAFMGYSVFFNYLIEEYEGKDVLMLNAYGGIPKEEAEKIKKLEIGAAICGCVARDGKRIIAENIQKTNDKRAYIVKSYGIRAYACHPIFSRGKVIGTLSFGTRLKDGFDEEELEFIRAIANEIATAMENKRSEESIKKEKEFSENILKSMPDGLDIVDESRNIIYMNNKLRNIFGREAIGKKCYEVYKDNKKPCESCPLNGKIRTGETKTIEVGGIANGKTFLISHTPVRMDGKMRVLEIFSDITERKKIENKIINLSRAVEQSHASMVITDINGTIMYVNPYFTEATGYTWEEAIGQNPRILKSGKQPKRVYKEMWDTIKSGKDWQGEFCNKKKNNELYWERVSVSPIKDGAGKIIRFVAVKEDITNHKRMEDALLAASERYRSYIEVTGQLGWTTNADGDVVEDIPSWREYTGQTYDEVKGWRWSTAIHPDDIKHTLKIWRKAVKEKKECEVEYRIRRYDGVYRHFIARGVPIFKKDGSIQEWIGTCIDITEIKENEEKLRQSRERYLLAQRAANIGSWDWDIPTGGLHWSEQIESLFGFKRGQFGRTYEAFLKCVHPDDRKLLTDSVNACLEKNAEYNVEHRIIWPDGSIKWVLERGDVIRDKNNTPVRMLGIVQDITQRKLAEDENIKSLKEKEVLLKEIHHRVKNNLQLVSSMLNLQFKGKEANRYMEAIEESKSRIRSIALIHEKLYRSKDFSHIDIAGYVKDLTSSLFKTYSDKSKGIELNINCDKIFVDVNTAIPCGLIANELVINSIKHAFPTEKKGTIEISCLDKNDNFVLSVKDDGVGLPEDSQLQGTNSIGLMLVKTLAEQLDAAIKIGRANGTSFEITVPKRAKEG